MDVGRCTCVYVFDCVYVVGSCRLICKVCEAIERTGGEGVRDQWPLISKERGAKLLYPGIPPIVFWCFCTVDSVRECSGNVSARKSAGNEWGHSSISCGAATS